MNADREWLARNLNLAHNLNLNSSSMRVALLLQYSTQSRRARKGWTPALPLRFWRLCAENFQRYPVNT